MEASRVAKNTCENWFKNGGKKENSFPIVLKIGQSSPFFLPLIGPKPITLSLSLSALLDPSCSGQFQATREAPLGSPAAETLTPVVTTPDDGIRAQQVMRDPW